MRARVRPLAVSASNQFLCMSGTNPALQSERKETDAFLIDHRLAAGMGAFITPLLNPQEPVRSTYGPGLHCLFDAVLIDPLPTRMVELVIRLETLTNGPNPATRRGTRT